MVIDKPAGTVVNRVETERGETVEEWAGEKTKGQGTRGKGQGKANFRLPLALSPHPLAFAQRAGIVHRLDKETSGCLIIAKTEEAFVDLQRQFREREVKKEYSALVHGKVEPNEGTIKVPIARSHHDSEKFAVVVGGRASETGYRVISYQVKANQPLSLKPNQQLITNNQQQFSLLRIFPLTGRTHQIRVHFKYFGHPLVSDEKYGGSAAVEDRKWCPRIFLHASKITFTHPVNKHKISVDSPLPEDLKQVIGNLKLSA